MRIINKTPILSLFIYYSKKTNLGGFMNSCELVTLISSVSCMLFKCYSEEEIELLAAILSQLGDTLSTMLANEGLCNKKSSPDGKDFL